MTSEQELRELVEKWRDDAEDISVMDGARDIEKCADELEELIEQ